VNMEPEVLIRYGARCGLGIQLERVADEATYGYVDVFQNIL
jgi:hypothetical protein